MRVVKKVNAPGAVVHYKGTLMEVIGIGEGRTITLRSLVDAPCARCGHLPGVSLLEHSPLFQDNVQPVETVEL